MWWFCEKWVPWLLFIGLNVNSVKVMQEHTDKLVTVLHKIEHNTKK